MLVAKFKQFQQQYRQNEQKNLYMNVGVIVITATNY